MRKKRAPEVRNLLAALKGKMARKGVESEAIVNAFKVQHRDAIAREIDDIIHIALMKLVTQVGSTRQRGVSATQLEMFTEYAVPKTVMFKMPNGTKIHRYVQDMTLREGREWIDEHTKPRARVTEEVSELIRLLDDIQVCQKSEGDTIGTCYTEFRNQQPG